MGSSARISAFLASSSLVSSTVRAKGSAAMFSSSSFHCFSSSFWTLPRPQANCSLASSTFHVSPNEQNKLERWCGVTPTTKRSNTVLVQLFVSRFGSGTLAMIQQFCKGSSCSQPDNIARGGSRCTNKSLFRKTLKKSTAGGVHRVTREYQHTFRAGGQARNNTTGLFFVR